MGKITSLKLTFTVLREADKCLAWLETNSGCFRRRFPGGGKVGQSVLGVVWEWEGEHERVKRIMESREVGL